MEPSPQTSPTRPAGSGGAPHGLVPPRLLGVFRTLVAAMLFTAIIGQLVISHDRRGFNPSNFFSFFTIESNVIAAVVVLVAGIRLLTGRDSVGMTLVRGAATLYMTMTGVVYNLLLRGINVETATPWVNEILHVWGPLLVLIDWLVDRRTAPLSYRKALLWLLFPLAYLPYTLIRGPIVNWYPYPFLDPRPHGYLHVVPYAIGIALFAAALAWFLVWANQFRRDVSGTRTSG